MGIRTHLLDLLPVPEVEETDQRVVPCARRHLARRQTSEIEFRPRCLDAFSVRQTPPKRVRESVDTLAEVFVCVDVHARQQELEFLDNWKKVGHVVRKTGEDITNRDARDVVGLSDALDRASRS